MFHKHTPAFGSEHSSNLGEKSIAISPLAQLMRSKKD